MIEAYQWDYDFKFVVLGDVDMIDTIASHSPRDSSQVNTINRDVEIYQTGVNGRFTHPKKELGTFLRKDPIHPLVSYFFESYIALVFMSRSWEKTQKLLREQNRPDLFKYITKEIPIYVIVEDSYDERLCQEYQELFRQYFLYMGNTLPQIFYREEKSNIFEILDEILEVYFLHYAKNEYRNDPKLTICTVCAICFSDKSKLRKFEDYVICTSCDPNEFDKEKFRAWLKIDRR